MHSQNINLPRDFFNGVGPVSRWWDVVLAAALHFSEPRSLNCHKACKVVLRLQAGWENRLPSADRAGPAGEQCLLGPLCLSLPGGDSLFLSGGLRAAVRAPHPESGSSHSRQPPCLHRRLRGHPRCPSFLGLASLLRDRVVRNYF